MTDEKPLPGEDQPVPVNGQSQKPGEVMRQALLLLTATIQDFVRMPDGDFAINPVELLVNLEGDACKVTALAECLLQAGVIDGADLVRETAAAAIRRVNRLRAEMAERPSLVVARGAPPPHKPPRSA